MAPMMNICPAVKSINKSKIGLHFFISLIELNCQHIHIIHSDHLARTEPARKRPAIQSNDGTHGEMIYAHFSCAIWRTLCQHNPVTSVRNTNTSNMLGIWHPSNYPTQRADMRNWIYRWRRIATTENELNMKNSPINGLRPMASRNSDTTAMNFSVPTHKHIFRSMLAAKA